MTNSSFQITRLGEIFLKWRSFSTKLLQNQSRTSACKSRWRPYSRVLMHEAWFIGIYIRSTYCSVVCCDGIFTAAVYIMVRCIRRGLHATWPVPWRRYSSWLFDHYVEWSSNPGHSGVSLLYIRYTKPNCRIEDCRSGPWKGAGSHQGSKEEYWAR